MSAATSGASTPRNGTPTPGDSNMGPSAMTVGTRFVKQYYHVLTTEPEQIKRFYQPTSILTQGVGSDKPTPPTPFEAYEAAETRFAESQTEDNGADKDNCWTIHFEFENGAIDAQPSMSGGVLLVVTGQVVYTRTAITATGEEDGAVQQKKKSFVHTFFLGSMTAGSKRSYYIHNDILRFLQEKEDEQQQQQQQVEGEVLELVSEEEVTSAREVDVVAEEPVAEEEEEEAVPSDEDNAPGGGVEETKEALLEDAEEAEDVAEAEEMPKEEEVSKAEADPVITVEVEKAKPNSWASLVASSSNPPTPTPGTPVRPPPPKKKPSPVPAPAAPEPTAESRSANRSTKRDPDCTLVIKHIDASTTEADILALFEKFAPQTNSKVIGTTVSGNRAIAFVDYDSAAPVLAAVEQQKKEPFKLNGKELEIHQKIDQRGRRSQGGRGGAFRGGGGGGQQNGNANRGGRQPFRRGGRGERGGGGGSGGGTTGGRGTAPTSRGGGA